MQHSWWSRRLKRETLESRRGLTDLQGCLRAACDLGHLPIPASQQARRFLLQNPRYTSPLALPPARGEVPKTISQVLRGEIKKTLLCPSCPRPAAPHISYSGLPQVLPVHLPTMASSELTPSKQAGRDTWPGLGLPSSSPILSARLGCSPTAGTSAWQSDGRTRGEKNKPNTAGRRKNNFRVGRQRRRCPLPSAGGAARCRLSVGRGQGLNG